MSLPGIQQKSHRLMELIQSRGLIQPSGLKDTGANQQGSVQPGSTEKGLTLLECLVAVSVMGLTIGLVLPPLFIASATRVQTRRAEQALQLAQGEVDRVRSLVALDQHFSTNLPAAATSTTIKIEDIAAPTKASSQIKTSAATCPGGVSITRYTGTQVPIDTALLVDIDADCQADFLMQVFRTPGILSATQQANTAANQRAAEFSLGVRVYSIVAGRTDAMNATPGSSLTGLGTKPAASLGLTNGQSNQLKLPLAVLYTSISWSDQDGTLCGYQRGNPNGSIESCQNFSN
jgi:type II secretory pathway pseudopilin PulG